MPLEVCLTPFSCTIRNLKLIYEIGHTLINIFKKIFFFICFAYFVPVTMISVSASETSDVLSLNLNSRAFFILSYSGQYFNIVSKLHIQPSFPQRYDNSHTGCCQQPQMQLLRHILKKQVFFWLQPKIWNNTL